MKRLICILLILCTLGMTVLAGCGNDYVSSEDQGDSELNVSLPEYTKATYEREGGLSVEEKKLVGVWRLVSVEQPNIDSYYHDAYYVFYDTGAYYFIINGQDLEGEFFAKDGILQAAGSKMKYVINNEILELQTNNGLTHRLSRVSTTTPDRTTIKQDSMDPMPLS